MKRLIKIIMAIIISSFAVWAVMVFGATYSTTYSVSWDESERFSDEELQAAADYVLKQFETGYKGCTLKRVYYDEVESVKLAASYIDEPQYDIYGMDPNDIIVLFSDFRTGIRSGSFEPNSNYDGWTWYLIRDGKGQPWREYSHGYA